MYLAILNFKDGHSWNMAFENSQISTLNISINPTKTNDKIEDFLSIKLFNVQLIIAPMSEVICYELKYERNEKELSDETLELFKERLKR